MSLTSYRAAPSRDRADGYVGCCLLDRLERSVFDGFGGDLLSHGLSRSTIGATGLIVRVREGIGSLPRAVTTKPIEYTDLSLRLIDRKTRDCLIQVALLVFSLMRMCVEAEPDFY